MKTPDIENAVRIYYTKPELESCDIRELFGASEATAVKLKKQVLQAMAERNIRTWLPKSINTNVAYEVWGIDIAEYENRLKKIRTLNLEIEKRSNTI